MPLMEEDIKTIKKANKVTLVKFATSNEHHYPGISNSNKCSWVKTSAFKSPIYTN